MDKKRSLSTRLWTDNWVLDLDPVEKLLFVYLLTNQSTNLAGIYELHLRKMAFETGIDKEMIQKILSRFEADGRVFYRHGYVVVANFTKHQGYNDSMIQNAIETVDNLPDEVKNDSLLTGCIQGVYRLGTPIGEIERETKIQIQNRKQKLKRESESDLTNDSYLLFSESGIKPEDVMAMIDDTPEIADADHEHYFKRAMDWSLSKDKRGPNWIATIRTWIRDDNSRGIMVKRKKTTDNEQARSVLDFGPRNTN